MSQPNDDSNSSDDARTLHSLGDPTLPEVIRQALARTPARVLAGRAGSGYRTVTALRLREDHAVARDAVHAEVNLLEVFNVVRRSAAGRHGVADYVGPS